MLERAKQMGKHFQRLSHVYIFPPRTTKKRNNEKKDKATKTTSSTAHKIDITTQQQ